VRVFARRHGDALHVCKVLRVLSRVVTDAVVMMLDAAFIVAMLAPALAAMAPAPIGRLG
jgi:hypothetical protein